MRWVNFSLLVPKFPLVAPRPLFKKGISCQSAWTWASLLSCCLLSAPVPCETGSPSATSATTKIEDQALAGSDGYSGKTERGAVHWSPLTCFSRRFYCCTQVAFSCHLLYVFVTAYIFYSLHSIDKSSLSRSRGWKLHRNTCNNVCCLHSPTGYVVFCLQGLLIPKCCHILEVFL